MTQDTPAQAAALAIIRAKARADAPARCRRNLLAVMNIAVQCRGTSAEVGTKGCAREAAYMLQNSDLTDERSHRRALNMLHALLGTVGAYGLEIVPL